MYKGSEAGGELKHLFSPVNRDLGVVAYSIGISSFKGKRFYHTFGRSGACPYTYFCLNTMVYALGHMGQSFPITCLSTVESEFRDFHFSSVRVEGIPSSTSVFSSLI